METAAQKVTEQPRGGLPKSRIETLVDGVFAIALTLLVLELSIPLGFVNGWIPLILYVLISAYFIFPGVVDRFWHSPSPPH